jgi:hypothetical protein
MRVRRMQRTTGAASLVADLVDQATGVPAAADKPAPAKNQAIGVTPHAVGRASPRESRLWFGLFHSNVERGGMSVLTRSDVWAGELRSVRPLVRKAWSRFARAANRGPWKTGAAWHNSKRSRGSGRRPGPQRARPFPPSSTVSGLALDGRSHRSCAPQCRWARCLRGSCGGRVNERSKGIVLITRLSSNSKL